MRLPAASAVASLVLRTFKTIALALFLLNIRSWPLSWHIRVFLPVYRLRFRYQLLRLRLFLTLQPASVRRAVLSRWHDELSPVGQNPFDLCVRYRTWAGPDDCDFNMHLSNSCYAKILDSARFKYGLAACPTFFRTGGWMALGATHFKYYREIPIGSRYEMRVSIVAWDSKWVYIATRYVTAPKKSKSKSRGDSSSGSRALPASDAVPFPDMHTPADGLATGASTPRGTSANGNGTGNGHAPFNGHGNGNSNGHANGHTNGHANGHANGHTNGRATVPELPAEPDGATRHCVALSAMCFKIGRITVPPALALACDGFCAPPLSTSDAESYSGTNPPPHWKHVLALRGANWLGRASAASDAHPAPIPEDSKGTQSAPARPGLAALRAFLTGGWRGVPPEERWWEQALGGVVEERRVAGMEMVRPLAEGLDGVGSLISA
ncbi:hypothetical protein CERSUDRAFT_87726 [Gelatoporia subvermispora B]|uniref:Thioesterase domain-containing protein n=1 Tax=Ceriporiopsis subvermispora (strain B) TaxID=914234 RepID=M2R1D1_CERS8|nr:hypothetical protein CERSUDRAFT_87726 [Gelatoporia subvermispora B]